MRKGLVYHGSTTDCIDTVRPKRNLRVDIVDGKEKIIFDQLSFHATPHTWIAVAYTHAAAKSHGMGVDLYGNPEDRVIGIYGPTSLEDSLQTLYGAGGYLYAFCGGHFFHTKGLGDLELITQKPIRPLHTRHIANPVEEMRREGVRFEFTRR